MSRTGGTVSRKSKTSTKSVERKSPAKRPRGTAKPTPAPARGSRAKPAPKPVRHGIRTSTRAVKIAPRSSRTAKPLRAAQPDSARKVPSAKVLKTDSTKEMKRTTPDRPKAALSNKQEPTKRKETAKAKEPVAAKEIKVKTVAAVPTPVPAPPLAVKETKAKTPKAATKATAPKVILPPKAIEEEITSRRKSPDHDAPPKPKGSRARAAKIPGFDDELMQDYVMDEESEEEEIQDEMALDPLELPLELLDPELVEVPRPAAPPKAKQKVATAHRRQQPCANCGNMYTWLSVDQLCFNCLKKRLAQRKREDESYSGFTPEAEEEEDFS